MHSLQYYLATRRGFRRALRLLNGLRLGFHERAERRRREQDPLNLMNFERRVHSQNGEDGIIEEIFRRIGTTDRVFVEFGASDGQECNTRLLLEGGWRGTWIEGSDALVRRAREAFAGRPVTILQRFVTATNIVELFREAGVPPELDLLSIDVDGNDYWIWRALEPYRPRVVVIEFNASFPPGRPYLMPYKEDHVFDGTRYYGASLEVLEQLGRTKGYRLVGCDRRGVNSFFVREDLLGGRFSHVEDGAAYHYTAPKYHGFFFGHPSGRGPWMERRA